MDLLNNVEQLTAARAAELVDGGLATLLDVRELDEWDGGHAPQAVHIALSTFETGAAPRGKPIVVMCHAGGRSQVVAELLMNADVKASNLSGGIMAWVAAGLPVVEDAD